MLLEVGRYILLYTVYVNIRTDTCYEIINNYNYLTSNNLSTRRKLNELINFYLRNSKNVSDYDFSIF